MASVPYNTSITVTTAIDTLTSVATTGASSSSPFGFTTAAQADAIVSQLNKIIALLKLQGAEADNA